MRKMFFGMLLAPACVAVLCTALPGRAMMIAPPPGPQKLVMADTVIVGRVLAIEDKDVEATQVPNAPQKVAYRVAIVRVTETIKGAKGKETIKVAWIAPPPQLQPVQPGGGIRPFIKRYPTVNLAVGQDGLFYLTKHHKEEFYVAPAYYSFLSSQMANYKTEIETARKTVKFIDDPMTGLKAEDAQDRLLAASILVTRYRTRVGPAVKTEAIPAEESKLILDIIDKADWNRPFRFGETSAQQLFNQLGLTAQDGWTPPQQIRTPQDYGNAVRDWIRQHRDTYRIQRFVAGTGT